MTEVIAPKDGMKLEQKTNGQSNPSNNWDMEEILAK